MENSLEIEMSISLKDFYRLLPLALKKYDYQIQNNIIDIGNGKIQINPGKETNRSIASLEFPILKVKFIFNKTSEKSINEFMDKFRRIYQKGGG